MFSLKILHLMKREHMLIYFKYSNLFLTTVNKNKIDSFKYKKIKFFQV